MLGLFLLMVFMPVLPNVDLTPGSADPAVTQANIQRTICKHGYTATVRNVPASLKAKVYAAYGMKATPPYCCEVDHLISLELGGSNDIANLWPQPYLPRPGAHEKDTLENLLHSLVCTGKLPLKKAQSCIANDWWACAKEFDPHRETH